MSINGHPSEASIERELEVYPEVCLDRRIVAINRIRQRRAILSYGRGVRQLNRDHAAHTAEISSVSQTLDRIEAVFRDHFGDEQWDKMKGEG